uniref:Uncharacterized protein n=1 Tax=Anguilla anguilla TaxID=7936 RepID=A0A0E9SNJ4_ANGAN
MSLSSIFIGRLCNSLCVHSPYTFKTVLSLFSLAPEACPKNSVKSKTLATDTASEAKPVTSSI